MFIVSHCDDGTIWFETFGLIYFDYTYKQTTGFLYQASKEDLIYPDNGDMVYER